MESFDKLIWAKSEPRISLACHMLSVGACTDAYLRAASSKGILRLLCAWLDLEEEDCIHSIGYVLSLHDIGKLHPDFQFRLPEVKEQWEISKIAPSVSDPVDMSFRHEIFSGKALEEIWKDNGMFEPKTARFLASVVRLHHQGKGNKKPASNVEWDDIRRKMERRMAAVFQPVSIHGNDETHWDALGILLTGLLVLMDWVASSEAFGFCENAEDDQACFLWAKRRAEKILSEFGLISEHEDAFPCSEGFDEFWPNILRKNIRPLQEACEDLKDTQAQLTIIEAPPGEGKTEAALYLAGQLCKSMHKQGIYMALPTTATSNQMVSRVRSLMKEHALGGTRLLHGSAWMYEEEIKNGTAFSIDENNKDDAEIASNWLKPLRRALLSENAVGTVDQAMASVLMIKYGMLRLLGLTNKVLVVDEIHAYDAYMSHILECLFDWCKALHIPVILLSATMHRKQKKMYLKCFTQHEAQELSNAYPLITQVDAREEIYEYPVGSTFMRYQCLYRALPMLGDVQALARYVLAQVRDGGCYCVMLNTVDRAQEVYRALRDLGETQVMLFHARFRMKERAAIEKTCLELFGRGGNRPQRMILVCTQVVEQSLDLDFDGMISELAPLDLLIQRAGRIHRHAENIRPKTMMQPRLDVIVPCAEAPDKSETRYGVLEYVYAYAELHNTEKWLGNERILRVPEDVRPAVDEVYETFDPTKAEIYVKKQVQESASRVKADTDLYRKPKADSFFGNVPSTCQKLILDDCDELAFSGTGAKTREAEDSVRVAFLPNDFDFAGSEREVAKKIMMESASIRLTTACISNIMNTKKDRKRVSPYKGCIAVLPQEDGTYLIGSRRFIADPVIGICEVKDKP